MEWSGQWSAVAMDGMGPGEARTGARVHANAKAVHRRVVSCRGAARGRRQFHCVGTN